MLTDSYGHRRPRYKCHFVSWVRALPPSFIMITFALLLAAGTIPFVAAAPAPVARRDCTAVGFSSGVYYSSYLQVSATVNAAVGKTITATIVVRSCIEAFTSLKTHSSLFKDKTTCIPYNRTDIALETIYGSALDRDWDYDATHGLGFSSLSVNGSNTVSFVAATPNGGTNLSLSVSGRFTPGVSTNKFKRVKSRVEFDYGRRPSETSSMPWAHSEFRTPRLDWRHVYIFCDSRLNAYWSQMSEALEHAANCTSGCCWELASPIARLTFDLARTFTRYLRPVVRLLASKSGGSELKT